MKIVYIALSILLVLLSFLVLFVGFKTAEGAPQETVVVGIACFIGILARIAQAAGHHWGSARPEKKTVVAQGGEV